MKTIRYFLLFILLASVNILAQTPGKTRVYVRAGVGASLPNSSGQKVLVLESSFQYETEVLAKASDGVALLTGNAGVGLTIDVSKHFTIGAELNVEQRGSRAAVEKLTSYCTGNCGIIYQPPVSNSATGQITTRLTYLTLPILASYHVGAFSVLAGPYVGLKLSEQQRGSYQPLINNAYTYITNFSAASDEFNAFDVGFTGGLGYALTPRFGVDLRYSRSLIRATKESTDYTLLPSVINQTVQVAARYNIIL
ncbi:porin family protein [Fibrella aquatilis]|uniref:PorT family protein n=1 Tax=Fibrella aquatilis TaxID=2817059 RepID=A0A939G8Q4_9BACT|nr:porin family protein [Fibrella aquatilis]MBO0934264.1 PorT family protein [Fibrella aquatilis]